MKWILRIAAIVVVLVVFTIAQIRRGNINKQQTMVTKSSSKSLVIVWSSGERDVADKMVFMYAYNGLKREWWDDITLIVWGPSGRLLIQDHDLQKKLKQMQDEGVVVKACKGCSDQLGISDELADLGIEVKYIGKELTDYIQSDSYVLTF